MRVVPEAVRTADVPRYKVERPAPHDAVSISFKIVDFVCIIILVIVNPARRAPFPYIAAQIEYTVRTVSFRETPNRARRADAGVGIVRAVRIGIVAPRIAESL